MNTIYKYPLKFESQDLKVSLLLPVDAKILSFQIQDNDFVLWAMFNEDKEVFKKERFFLMVGTGWAINYEWDELNFIDTVQSPDNTVWHLFEIIK